MSLILDTPLQKLVYGHDLENHRDIVSLLCLRLAQSSVKTPS